VPSKQATILVVDDDAAVLRGVTTSLASGNYQVIVAEDGAAGLAVYLERRSEIALVISDITMPRMNGVEMAQRITAAHPDAKILLMTGYTDAVVSSGEGPMFPLLYKPFLADQLLGAVRWALESS
jgi:DNA-binding NtrC family response regulator